MSAGAGPQVVPARPPGARRRPAALAAALALAALAPGAPASAAGLLRGPYLQNGSGSAVTVRWRTDVPTDGEVAYGPEPGALTATAVDPVPTTEHEIRLTGLAPGTRYFYSVGSSLEVLAGGDSSCAFVTAPAPGVAAPTRVWAIGDSGLPGLAAERVRDAFLAHAGASGADVWLLLGDNAYPSGTDAEYQAGFFDTYESMARRTAAWPTRGNHDVLHGGANNDYYELFTLPLAGEAGGVPSATEAYYSFDHGEAHFVCLDSEGTPRDPSGAMAQWLAADLLANTRRWVIAYWHHPPYTKGSHNSDNPADSDGRMRDMRANVLPILEAHGVDLVLTGHSHSYERSVLLDGHYDVSSTLEPWMMVDPGDGRVDGDGPYAKPSSGAAAHEGAVYAVAGSSSRTGGGALDHPVMAVSLDVLGSLVLDVDGDRLDGLFLDADGAHRDSFTIVKGTVAAEPPAAASTLRLLPAAPNPSDAGVRLSYRLPAAGGARISIVDARGRRLATPVDGERPAGLHQTFWDGRDDRGHRAAPGVYFAQLEFGGHARVQKLVVAP